MGRIKLNFEKALTEISYQFEELSVSELKVKLRAGIDVQNWQPRAETVFSALADNERPVVLALDEIPILVNRLLKDDDGRITPDGRRETDAFLSWLRMNGQHYRGKVSIILSGSVGLEPILQQAALSSHINIFSSFDLKPWSEETAAICLEELSNTYDIDLSLDVRLSMCRRLRCCIPHHVQMFFDMIHNHLRRKSRREASLDDVEWVYLHKMLSVRGQMDLQHYEGRLETILGRKDYPIALEILTHTATHGSLDEETAHRYEKHFKTIDEGIPSVKHVMHVLYHDGYLERREADGASRFVSRLLEDWWRSRYGKNFVSVIES